MQINPPMDKPKSYLHKIVAYLCYIMIMIRLLESWILHPHGDALYYHLVGGKLWLESSFLQMTESFIPFFLGGYFDYLYVIPQAIFGTSIFTQISGQMMHLSASLLIAATLLICFYKHSIWGFLTALTILTISKSPDYFLFAKNDGVLAFITLLSAMLIFEKKLFPKIQGSRRAILIGISLGLIPAIKISGLFAVAPLAIFYTANNRKNLREVCLSAVVALLVWSPILLRNWYFLQSPFYPGFLQYFPGNLMPSSINYFTGLMTSSVSLTTFGNQFIACFGGKFLFYIAPIIMIINYKLKKEGNIYFATAFIFFLLYSSINPTYASERYYFPCYFLLAFFIFKSLSQYRLKPFHIIIILIAILADSKIDKSIKRLHRTAQIYTSQLSQKEILNKMIPLTIFWNYIDEGSLVISDTFSQAYYSKANVQVHKYEEHRSAEFIGNCDKNNIGELAKYSYAILAKNPATPCYQLIISKGKLLHQDNIYKLYDIRGIRGIL